MVQTRKRASKVKKDAAKDTIRAASLRCQPRLSWFETDKVIDIYDDHLILHMYDPKENKEMGDKRKKVDVQVDLRKIEEAHEQSHGDGSFKVLLLKMKGDLVSNQGDIIASDLVIFFRNKLMGEAGSGQEDRLKLIHVLEQFEIVPNNVDSSGSSSPRSEPNASQEGQEGEKGDQGDSSHHSDEPVAQHIQTHDEPQSGPGSPVGHAFPNAMPTNLTQTISQQADLDKEKGGNDDDEIDSVIKHPASDESRRSLMTGEATRGAKVFQFVEKRLDATKVDEEKHFQIFKQKAKSDLWREVKAGLQEQDSMNLNIEMKLKESGDRMTKYGKQFDSILSQHEMECRVLKNIVQKVLQDVEVQQIHLAHNSSSTGKNAH